MWTPWVPPMEFDVSLKCDVSAWCFSSLVFYWQKSLYYRAEIGDSENTMCSIAHSWWHVLFCVFLWLRHLSVVNFQFFSIFQNGAMKNSWLGAMWNTDELVWMFSIFSKHFLGFTDRIHYNFRSCLSSLIVGWRSWFFCRTWPWWLLSCSMYS